MKSIIMIAATAAFVATATSASAADGAEVYSKNCAKCHGADGKGATPMGKKLKIKDLTVEQKKLSDEQVVKSIKEGVIEDGKQRMKPIKGLSDDDIAAVVKYVRSLK
ncbi:MAG: cytochrome c [Luteolibacter sp.]|jgi:mono/diheme cytochrome c family protein|nr:cytochrome c [Luteolibacter sp.]